MRQHLIGLAAAMAAAVVSAPAMANCGGCAAPIASFSSCTQPVGFNPCGGPGYATLPEPDQYYSAEPQYYWVNQGPTYTGPGMFAPAPSYQERAVSGWSGYGEGRYGYSGGPYAHPSHHYYHGMPAATVPTIYSYRRAYRPAYRYGYRHAPRYGVYAPRVYAPRMYAPRAYRGHVHVRPSVRYGYRHHHVAPRYAAPRRMPHRYR